MYQALLTRKYLTSKVMPLLAMVAVMLSVATVLITWSIMGGFLKVLLDSGRPLIGDAVVHWPNVGFGHYDDLIDRLEAHPRLQAAAPMIETFGLVQLPNGYVRDVQIKGVDPESFNRVTHFEQTLWWRPLDKPTPKDHDREDPRLDDDGSMAFYLANAESMTRPDPVTAERKPAAIPGIELSQMLKRTSAGIYLPQYNARPTPDGDVDIDSIFMPRDGSLGMTLLALDAHGTPVDSITRRIAVANEFQSGVYEVDSQTVLVPLDWLQPLLHMDEARTIHTEDGKPFDPFATEPADDGEPVPAQPTTFDVAPARVTTVLVRGVDDATPAEVKDIIEHEVYPAFAAAHKGEVPPEYTILVRTWEDLNATLIASVKKETGLVLFIFGIVCFTTVFLVLAIFWSMVSEKTKDIGILRALGASTPGVAWLWLRYGAAIGFVGASLGTGAGYLIVTNINAIHDWLGSTFHLTIWDPRVYYFTEIPRQVDWHKALIVFLAGVLTCLVGAAWPAWRAARMRPVQALRFE